MDDDIIESAVSVVDSDSELVVARELVRRKLRSVASLEPQAQARRLVAMLARKGYAPGLAFGVVRETLAAADGPADDLLPDDLSIADRTADDLLRDDLPGDDLQ